MMAVVPDTGGGLSGFIAHGLWKLYQYFPSSGRWDWLLLVFLLAVLVRVLYLPLLWKSVKADMDLLKEGKIDVSHVTVITALWDIGSAFFLAWFFYTTAGQTFLPGRFGRPDAVATGLWFWLPLGGSIAVTGGVALLAYLVYERNKAMGPSRSVPYADRRLLSLFGGGGVFTEPAAEGNGKVVPTDATTVTPVLMESMLFCSAYMYYWYWSVASVTIFSAFILSGVLTEIVRMVFVYILHRQVFGRGRRESESELT